MTGHKTKHGIGHRLNKNAGYFFIAPWLIGFVLFTMLPMCISFVLSLTKYNVISSPEYYGLGNYVELFTGDKRLWASFGATLKYVFIQVPLRLIFSLFIAILLYKTGSRLVGVYRALLYLPSVIGGSVAMSVMWRQVFGIDGVVNYFLQKLGLIDEAFNWISRPGTAMASLIILGVWQFGSPMLIFLAGLKQIPNSYYEAASIDGAGWFNKLRRITLPLLTPIIFFNLLMQMIGAFMCFTEAYIITSGGPMDKTLFYVLYLYQKSFGYYQMGFGCAMAWILLLIMGIITAVIFKTSNYWVFYESKGGR